MTTAWTRGIAVGLLAWPLAACEVRVNDDLDGVGGVAGSFATAGRGGNAGSAGQGGSGGVSGSGGASGSSGGGQGGGEPFPAPTCTAEAEDEGDECVQCLKQACCGEWLGCDDQTCSDEWQDTAACVLEYQFPDVDDLGMCMSESAATDSMTPQANTISLLDCINVEVPPGDGGVETTRCGRECFGIDIFYE